MNGAPMGPRDVARVTGVSTDTLRHYERKGLLPGITRSGRVSADGEPAHLLDTLGEAAAIEGNRRTRNSRPAGRPGPSHR